MATVQPTVSGTWVWNEDINDVSGFNQSVTFNSNTVSYNSIRTTYETVGVDSLLVVYYDSTKVYYDNPYWYNQAYRTIDFGTSEQTVSQEFYNYLTTNAVQQSTPQPPTNERRKYQ